MSLARVVAVALCLMGCSAVPALAQGPTVGLEAGIGLSRISPDAAGQSISRGPGLLAGAYVQMPLFTTIGLQLELRLRPDPIRTSRIRSRAPTSAW